MSGPKRKYPPKNATTCIVCEDIRAEATGKLMMIGVYPGGTINFAKQPTEESPGQLNLALSIWFRKLSGEFQVRIAINGPNGAQIIERELGSQTIEAGKILALTVRIQNAEFVSHGEYEIVIYLDEKTYSFPLFVTFTNEA